MSPNIGFPLHESPQNAITQRILAHPRVTFDVGKDVLVIAIKDELLVRTAQRVESSRLDQELSKIARNCGSLGAAPPSRDQQYERPGEPPVAAVADDVEIWRLTDPSHDSIDQARRLRTVAHGAHVRTFAGPSSLVPPVSPNHVCVVSRPFDCCPAGPPLPTPAPPPEVLERFVGPLAGEARASVVVIDSGYIRTNPPYAALDARVTLVPGQWFDTSTVPATWRDGSPDVVDADHDGRLDGVAGHGTFVAGMVAHHCDQAQITVVGQRHECMPLADPPDPVDQAQLFTTEFAVAHSLLMHANADVVSCGFAFPTLDDQPSMPFNSVMQALTGPGAPRPGIAVVAPAGNETSARPYWPAAHPDVIGVAAANRRGSARAAFSNWGTWANCCTRGQHVRSTFVDWRGPVEGEPDAEIDDFCGWAIWDGTSFAAPKVSGAIARLVAEHEPDLLPVDAFQLLISGAGGVTVTPLTDTALTPFPGVTLPNIHLG